MDPHVWDLEFIFSICQKGWGLFILKIFATLSSPIILSIFYWKLYSFKIYDLHSRCFCRNDITLEFHCFDWVKLNISSIILINLMVIWISRLSCKCSIHKVFDFVFEEGSWVWVLAHIYNLDLFVYEEMLSYVGEAWCCPDNLVTGRLHLSHILHYHRQSRSAWG